MLGSRTAADRAAPLTVDAHLARLSPPAEASNATIAIDLSIFDENGQNEIQIEDLTVRALANTLPKDDREFYLQTVMDVDPTDEIVRPHESTLYGDQGMMLIESCSRIASFSINQRRLTQLSPSSGVLRNSLTIATMASPTDTNDEIDNIIRESAYPSYLEAVKRESERDPFRLSTTLPGIMSEAPQVAIFRNHIGRIVKQITHRYPWMNILYLPAEGVDITKSILAAIGTSFQSFTVGLSQGYSPSKGENAAVSSLEGVVMKDIDFTQELGDQIAPFDRLDLVLLPSALLGVGESSVILEAVTKAMKPGAFLVLMNPRDSILRSLLQTYTNGKIDRVPTPPHWPDTLDSYGFIKQARYSDQFYKFGDVAVRQFGANMAATVTSRGIRNGNITQDLLLIKGTAKTGGNELATDLADLLSPGCDHVKCRTLDDASVQDLQSCTGVIILADLDEPVISNMTEQRINQLRTLLRPNLVALWVTRDARTGNPEHAASFGFIRTIAAEIPTLRLQVLDLVVRPSDPMAETIASTFATLATAGNNTDPDSLWTIEPEIHIEAGRRLVPRVIPWKEANERANSRHRVVERTVNTLSQCVELVLDRSSTDSSLGFEIEVKEQDNYDPPPGLVAIRVDYSSALPFNMSEGVSAYACVGREWETGKRIAAFSNMNASYITVPTHQTLSLHGEALPSLTVLNLLIRSIAALSVISEASHKDNIILIDPDVDFAKSLVGLLASDKTSRITILGSSDGEASKSSCFASLTIMFIRLLVYLNE